MENASKALLIAGSILIVILLIAMGVKVFTSTQGTTDQTEKAMQSTEVATFNNQFLQFVGTQSSSQARALISKVIASNATNKAHTVTINSKTPNINMSLSSQVTISVTQDTNRIYN